MLTIIQEGESAEKYIEDLQLRKPEDEGLMQIVQRTLKGTMTGEEQLMVKFDRALATKGTFGDANNGHSTIKCPLCVLCLELPLHWSCVLCLLCLH